MYIACSEGETMETTNVASSKNKQRYKLLTLEHTLLVEIHRRLCRVYGKSVVVNLHTVEQWHKKFAKGRMSIDDAAQSGRLSETIDEMVHCVRALLKGTINFVLAIQKITYPLLYALYAHCVRTVHTH